MNEELAKTVNDILNRAADGIGDISGWLASDGLPSYMGMKCVDSWFWVVAIGLLAIAMYSVLTFCITKYRAAGKEGCCSDEEFYSLFAILSAVLAAILTVVLLFLIPNAIGWTLYPEGRLLEVLVGALGK